MVDIGGPAYARLGVPLGGPAGAKRGASTLVNGMTLFSFNGPIQLFALGLFCVTENSALASTVRFNMVPTIGSAATISGISGSLISATVGTSVLLLPTALNTVPTIVAGSAGGIQLIAEGLGRIIVPAGDLKLVVATGPTLGTWEAAIAYWPMGGSVIMS